MDLPDILRIPSEKGIGIKKKVLILFTVIMFCSVFCGCSLWMDGQYTSIRPHEEQQPAPDQEIVEVSDYSQLRQALVEIVSESKENALGNCDADIVLLVSQYNEVDLPQMIQDYANNHPDTVMEIPQVSTAVYPDNGTERIIEIKFTYQTSRQALRTMQETVEPIFKSAELYVSGDSATEEKHSQLYSFFDAEI